MMLVMIPTQKANDYDRIFFLQMHFLIIRAFFSKQEWDIHNHLLIKDMSTMDTCITIFL